MEKDVKDFQCYATAHQKELVLQTFNGLLKRLPEFSKLTREVHGFNFTEYSILYVDLVEFYNTALMTRNTYKVKDIISFRNSFELIFRRLEKISTCEQVSLYVFFRDKLQKFQEWSDEIEQIAISTLARQ